ncbi:TadE/TadG family type IV pilus assembly protein [Silicimonas sp. MF1-12-2]|uniref:TadE/TadG family type IV pilus assembly protein n=1 Tax=Silicimonas sp. MF1-12-2 TaxID=3384793 RepID=UPI0039B6E175
MNCFVKKLRKFANKQDGNATIEFVILFPGIMFLFLVGFEAGYYMVRNASLERAVDISVRDVRLSNGQIPNLDQFKQNLCAQANILENCEGSVKVDVEPIAKGSGGIAAVANGPVRCVDKAAPANRPANDIYDVGAENQMMVMRVCLLSQPMFPTTGLGVGMKIDTDGNYAIVATTAFVNEPGARDLCGTGNGVGCGTGYGGGNGNNMGVGATNGLGIGGDPSTNSGDGNGNSSATNGDSGTSNGNGASTSSGNQGNGNGNVTTGTSGSTGTTGGTTISTNNGNGNGNSNGNGNGNGGTCDPANDPNCI